VHVDVVENNILQAQLVSAIASAGTASVSVRYLLEESSQVVSDLLERHKVEPVENPQTTDLDEAVVQDQKESDSLLGQLFIFVRSPFIVPVRHRPSELQILDVLAVVSQQEDGTGFWNRTP
jgi:hypothetical protein